MTITSTDGFRHSCKAYSILALRRALYSTHDHRVYVRPDKHIRGVRSNTDCRSGQSFLPASRLIGASKSKSRSPQPRAVEIAQRPTTAGQRFKERLPLLQRACLFPHCDFAFVGLVPLADWLHITSFIGTPVITIGVGKNFWIVPEYSENFLSFFFNIWPSGYYPM